MSDFADQLRLAARRLTATPGYSAAMLVNLILGLGAFTALLGVIDSVLLAPLPYPDADRLVVVRHEMPGISAQGEPTLFGGFQGQVHHYAERSAAIEEIGLLVPYDAAIETDSAPEHVRAAAVSAGFLRALGVDAVHGRLFEDNEPAAQGIGGDALLLDGALWARVGGGDPAIVGTTRNVDGADAEIVGVLGEPGPFPTRRPALWTARTDDQIAATPQLLVNLMLVKLRPGATAASLAGELDALIAELPGRIDDAFVRRAVDEGRMRTRVTPLADYLTGNVASSLWLMLGAAALVLAAAMVNATGLQLLRREAERREIAVRHALGARRAALLRHHGTELALLVGGAWIVAAVLAGDGLTWLRTTAAIDLPRAAEIGLSARALASSAAAAAMGVLWLLVVRVALPSDLLGSLRGSATGAGAQARGQVRNLTAAAQIAVATCLLIAAGLVLRTFVALHDVDPGFDPEGVLAFRVPFPAKEIQAAGGLGVATPVYDEFRGRLEGFAGIERAGYARCAPFMAGCSGAGLTLRPADRQGTDDADETLFFIMQASPGYLETLGVPLIAGRGFVDDDHQNPRNAAIVSRDAAAALWPDDPNPIGRQLLTPDLPHFTSLTVVGVAGEARHASLRVASEPTVYLPVLLAEQTYELDAVSFVARTASPPLGVAAEVRTILAGIRSDVPMAGTTTLGLALADATAQLRLAIALLGGASLAVLLLGTTGVYGVIAYSVSLRRSEFGVRLALGADPPRLRRLVVRQASRIAAIGVVTGILAALAGGRLLESVMFGVQHTDPLTYTAVAALLGLATWLAGIIPAHRAGRTDPAVVLRSD